MKKIIYIFMACVIVCCSMCACDISQSDVPEPNSKNEITDNTKDDEAIVITAENDSEKVICSYINIGDVTLSLGEELTEDILNALGEPENLIQAPSCHYDGTDNIYFYSGLTLYTYLDNEKAVLYSIEVSDSNYPTPEGVQVGMTLTEVEEIYGNIFEEIANGISYSLGDGMVLNFRTENEYVTVIEYYME